MKVLIIAAVIGASLWFGSGPLAFKMKDIDGKEVDLAKIYAGKVVLMVNVASKCGLTPQYEELEKIYETYKDKGFVVLGFPANEFGAQEPGTNEEIKQFCTSQYKVTFPMFSKIVVKGEGINPLYKFLTEKETNPASSGEIKWNFTKFLIGRDGKLIARFEPKTTPKSKDVTDAIEKALAAPAPAGGS
jgi:glutathione peroxidase